MPPTKIDEIADFDVTRTLIDGAAQQGLSEHQAKDWLLDHSFMLVPAQQYVANFLATFQEFAPRQNAASFSLEQVVEKLTVPDLNQ